jgi:hypothetical protein
MQIKQLSIFLENKSGRVAEVTKILADAGIDMRALVISDTTDFGILRLIVDQYDKAYSILKENKFTVSLTDVVVVGISDEVGSLASVLQLLNKLGIGIEYMYAFLNREVGEVAAVLRVEDVNMTIELLLSNNVKVLSKEDL